LEMHYDNSRLATDVVDHSGLKLSLTPTKQPIEAGTLFLATPEEATSQIIPPGEPAFRFYSYFEDCLRETIPEEGTELGLGQLHLHTHGRRIKMRHFRNGVELEPLLAENNYDFFYQQFRKIEPMRRIFPGDKMVLECIYDTTNSTIPIYGGYSTREEMCASTFLYWPRVASGYVCTSAIDPKVYVPMFGAELIGDDTVRLNKTGDVVSLRNFVKDHLDWTIPNIRQTYQEYVESGNHILDLKYTPVRKANASITDDPVKHEVFQLKGFSLPIAPTQPPAVCANNKSK